jgi:tetratricopeptide (TPR) repeat protein
MRITLRVFCIVAVVSSAVWLLALPSGTQQTSRAGAREEGYGANNIGVALLEQFKYAEAVAQFRRALEIDTSLAVARINLAIALFNVPDLQGALREAKLAAAAMPDTPHPHYMLGLIATRENRVDEALAAFQRVLQIDPRDVGANVNIGQLYFRQRKYAEAIPPLRVAHEAEPYNISAAYTLGLALTRGNQREEGQRMLERFQALRAGGYGTELGQNYLEQGRYAEAIASTGAEPELVDANIPEVTFVDATTALLGATASPQSTADVKSAFGRQLQATELTDAVRREIAVSLSGAVTLLDYDSDGDLDLFEAAPSAQRLLRNDASKYVDVTAQSGLVASKPDAVALAVVAGDYDNDTRPDLFVLRYGASALYHNDGNGKFSDVTAAAGIPAFPFLALSAAFVDSDHDGDLDIFIAGFVDMAKPPSGDKREIVFPGDFAPAPNLLLRNNGDGKFTDITEKAQLLSPKSRGVAVVPTDYDNRRDVDLLVVSHGDAPVLFGNLRDGTYRNITSNVGLEIKGGFTCVAAGDVNKDGYTDFFFGRGSEVGLFAGSDGRGRFLPAPVEGTEGAAAAQLFDYDNDGLLDLVLAASGKLRVIRNVAGKWQDTTSKAIPADVVAFSPAPRAFASGDIDKDGDTDLVVRSAGGFKLLRNDGGSRNRSLRVQLAGKVSNRSAVGAKVEVRAGSLRQRAETYAASPAPAPVDVVFGLGKRSAADAVRVLWPAGIVQAETELAELAQSFTVTELDRKPSSCPYLYAWDGERFAFITDLMGGGEMGYWMAPGARNHPDPDEYVRIRDDHLKPRDGRYEIRVTNELEETVYIDRLELVVVSHPADIDVFPNEGLVDPPRPPFKLYRARGARPPIAAADDHGHDVLARLRSLDRQYPDDFKLHHIRGYAEEHSLTVDLGTRKGGLLLLTGWTDYAFSSDNVAAHQSGLALKPPALQVKDARGRWKTVIADIGIPVGRPQTLVVDLKGILLAGSTEVRIVTNMRIYWDQILVAEEAQDAGVEIKRLDAATAELRWRGFSAEVTPDGREPFLYDYNRVSLSSPWKVMPGRYTREGDVRELLVKSDDMFVVSRPGDEIALSFDANALGQLPAGWKRTFLLYADGFTKEMDINSASPDQVEPLPFHAMSRYPYSEPEKYPMTRARRRYIERYNTRVVRGSVRSIESELFSRQLGR